MKKSKKILMLTLVLALTCLFSISASAFSITKNSVTVPNKLKVGQTFSVKGRLTSDQTMCQVVVSIIKDGVQLQRHADYPYSTYYDLARADNYMIFDRLPAGNYIYRISAYNSNGSKCTAVNKQFTVGANSKIVISGAAPAKDFSISKGTGVVVGGKISSNSKLTSVTAKIKNGSGKVYFKKTVHPNSTVYNMTAKKAIDNAMLFNQLPVGSYIFTVTAKNASGKTSTVIKRKFTVKVGNTSGDSTGNGDWSGINNGMYSDITYTIPSPSGFSPRTTRPAASNKFYYNKNYNTYYRWDSLAPTGRYTSGGYVIGNCTWYACGRAMEIANKKYGAGGVSKVQSIFGGDPVDIFNANKRLGKFKYGKTPKPGAIAVFNYGGSGDAHVAIVEAVINGVPYVSESGYKVQSYAPYSDKSNVVFWYQSIYSWANNRQLLGYIYLI